MKIVELRVFSKKKKKASTVQRIYLSLFFKYYEYFTNHLHKTIAFWDGQMKKAIFSMGHVVSGCILSSGITSCIFTISCRVVMPFSYY